jgi:hypothetical protein
MADTFFRKCPSCSSTNMELNQLTGTQGMKGTQEYCKVCMYVVNYVKFTCGHCCPDVFALCPTQGCAAAGTPTKQLCIT